MVLFLGICCLVIILITAALNASVVRMAQHRTTLFPGSKLPKWWPSQKHLGIITVVFNWIMTITSIANCISLIVINHASYIISYGIGGVICWLVGSVLGIWLTSAAIKTIGKKHGINVMRECL